MQKKIFLEDSILKNKKKILFPKSAIRKEQIGEYYKKAFKFMAPFLKNRPISMQRFPDGIKEDGFYQKNIPEYFPRWIKRKTIKNLDGTKTTYIIVENKETLIYLAHQGCITIHIWLSQITRIKHPTQLVIDLDPGEGTTFSRVRKYALELNNLLKNRNLKAFPMLTGSRGIHVTVPIEPTRTFKYVKLYSRKIAQKLVEKYPQDLTIEISKKQRKNKIFLDYIRNNFGQTSVAPYSIRPIESAPVATPITWKQVEKGKLGPQDFNIFNVFEHIKGCYPNLKEKKWSQNI